MLAQPAGDLPQQYGGKQNCQRGRWYAPFAGSQIALPLTPGVKAAKKVNRAASATGPTNRPTNPGPCVGSASRAPG